MPTSQVTPQPALLSPLARRHSIDDRTVLWSEDGGWQILLTARNAADHAARVWSGRLGLQLWHPPRRVSVLLPSSETDGHYEIYPLSGEAQRLGCYHGVCHVLESRLSMDGSPPARLLTDLHVHFVLSAAIGATAPAGASS